MAKKRSSTLTTKTIGGVDHVDTARILDRIGVDIPSHRIEETRTGDAIYAPRPVGDRIVLGKADDYRNGGAGVWLVCAQQLDRPWPGTDQTVTFSAERQERQPNGTYGTTYAVGAFSEEDCWLYLTKRGKFAVTVYSLRGESSEEVRQGLGIPDGMCERDIADLTDVLQDRADLDAAWAEELAHADLQAAGVIG